MSRESRAAPGARPEQDRARRARALEPRSPARRRVRLGLAGLAGLALLWGPGCATQADVNRAVSDDLRLTGRVMGFALDAATEALQTRLALLEAYEGDPRRADLERRLGTVAEVEQKLERLQEARRSLVEESQRLRERYEPAP